MSAWSLLGIRSSLALQGMVFRMTSINLSQLRRGVLGPLVLTLIGTEERYGLELVRILSASSLPVSEGTVYPLLSRLVESGLVESRWLIQDAQRPRRVYRLTPQGLQASTQFRAEWRKFSHAVNAILEANGRDTSGSERRSDG